MKLHLVLVSMILVLAACATTTHKESDKAEAPKRDAAQATPDNSAAKDPGLQPAVIGTNPTTPPVPVENSTVDSSLSPAPAAAEPATTPAVTDSAEKADSTSGATVTLIKKGKANEKSEPAEAAAAPAEKKKSATAKGVDPKKALTWLQHGNQRFVKGGKNLRKDGQAKKDIKRVSLGQKPHAIVIACSDSRVPPEIVFDQKLGEIYVVRTFGETLDDNAIASVEYAVQQLGPRLIVVLGHTYCGAINAAIETQAGAEVGSPAFSHLIAEIQPHIKDVLSQGTPEADGARESFANARGVEEDLKARSDIVRQAVENDDLMIQPALYHLDTGEVKFK